MKNNKHASAMLKPAETTGIGINNARRRLQLLYCNRFKLDIADEKTTYTVQLNLQL